MNVTKIIAGLLTVPMILSLAYAEMKRMMTIQSAEVAKRKAHRQSQSRWMNPAKTAVHWRT